MKTLIIYTSQTGFTKKYSEWLADRMQADLFDLKDVQKKDASFFEAYETIVYAGWCMAGTVVKVKWFLEKASAWKNKRLAVVCVGGCPNDAPETQTFLQQMLTDEQKQYIKGFYCQGGFDYDKMKGPSKLAMKMFASALKKKKDEKSRQMAEYVSHSYDISDMKFIEPIVEYLMGA